MAQENWKERRDEILRLSNEESHRVTRESIEQALVWLMRDKPFHEITVTDITKRAGVSRAAYYRNYESKEDVLRSMVQASAEEMFQSMMNSVDINDSRLFWCALFRGFQENESIYRILLQAGQSDALLTMFNRLAATFLPKQIPANEYHLRFWAGAVFNVVNTWIFNEMRESPEEMAQFMAEMIR